MPSRTCVVCQKLTGSPFTVDHPECKEDCFEIHLATITCGNLKNGHDCTATLRRILDGLTEFKKARRVDGIQEEA